MLSLKLLDITNETEAILLGFQHYLVMLGTTVVIPTTLVPQMGGENIRSTSSSMAPQRFHDVRESARSDVPTMLHLCAEIKSSIGFYT
ncbi:hypothetical protein HanIR_Chr10g0499311 [Helianthus annuus]|nr:hypothetical protein HanIR_Chr10g0499311 [Helianthus annuus]